MDGDGKARLGGRTALSCGGFRELASARSLALPAPLRHAVLTASAYVQSLPSHTRTTGPPQCTPRSAPRVAIPMQACQLDPSGSPCVFERWTGWDAIGWSSGPDHAWDSMPTEMDCRELCCRCGRRCARPSAHAQAPTPWSRIIQVFGTTSSRLTDACTRALCFRGPCHASTVSATAAGRIRGSLRATSRTCACTSASSMTGAMTASTKRKTPRSTGGCQTTAQSAV